ncbi:MAG: ribulose-phosphate 3-epimerase [Calditrichia bacterium]|nr:ribulose-phosphate 3-epimerase [Calditrichia bacterium]
MQNFKILPSILSCDLRNIIEEIKQVEIAGADWLHIDIMDGHFVPNITFGPNIIKTIKKYFPELQLDVHLMISNAEDKYMDYIKSGSDFITVHAEAVTHLHRLIQQIKNNGVKAGVVLNPASPIAQIEPVLPDVDMVLLMSVNPGFPAQKFIPGVLNKVKKLCEIRKENNFDFIIEMDGGVNAGTIQECIKSGAEWFVAGNAVFGDKEKIRENFTKLSRNP